MCQEQAYVAAVLTLRTVPSWWSALFIHLFIHLRPCSRIVRQLLWHLSTLPYVQSVSGTPRIFSLGGPDRASENLRVAHQNGPPSENSDSAPVCGCVLHSPWLLFIKKKPQVWETHKHFRKTQKCFKQFSLQLYFAVTKHTSEKMNSMYPKAKCQH